MRSRLLDPADHKRTGLKDKALSHILKQDFGGKYNNQTDAPRLRALKSSMHKSIERHEEKEIRKGGTKNVRNIKGKINYFKHLTDRARRRGEEE